MSIRIVNPLDHPGWDELLLNSGDHSFFHTSAWARCLLESYGYKPIYFACIEGGRLSFLWAFMEVASLLTGKRGVSLPFTDECPPYMPAESLLGEAVQAVIDYGRHAKWKYAEWRGAELPEDLAASSQHFLAHDIDLDKTEAEMFSGLKDANRRNINKALRDGIKIEFEAGLDSLSHFYRLNCSTRRRHGLPPQPLSFFKNIYKFVISAGYGTLVTARYDGKVAASSVFFHFGRAAIFKYGASDPKDLGHRPNNLLMWEAIKWYKARGMNTLSLGRTDIDDLGLIRFKRSWNAVEAPLKYCRFDFGKGAGLSRSPYWEHGNKLFTAAPMIALRTIGKMLYRHMG